MAKEGNRKHLVDLRQHPENVPIATVDQRQTEGRGYKDMLKKHRIKSKCLVLYFSWEIYHQFHIKENCLPSNLQKQEGKYWWSKNTKPIISHGYVLFFRP